MASTPNVPRVPGAPKAPSTPAAPQNMTPPGLPPTTSNDETFEEDFTGITAGGGMRLLPEGYYLMKVTDLSKTFSQSGNPQFQFDLIVAMGENRGVTMKHWTSLLPQARWKVVQMLEALGVAAQDSVAKFRKSEVVGRYFTAKIAPREYNGKVNNNIEECFTATADEIAAADKLAKDIPF